MKRFFLRFFIFSLPIVLLLFLPLAAFLISGELTSVNWIVKQQLDPTKKILFGRAYSNPAVAYKNEAVRERRPEIIALGSSLVMQFRSEFFRQPEKFYNAGGAISMVNEYNFFLDNLPKDYRPKVVIINLDPNSFNPVVWKENYSERYETADPVFRAFFNYGWRKIYEDFFTKKLTLADLMKQREIETVGVTAKVKKDGFRNDGSYDYTGMTLDPDFPGSRDELLKTVVADLAAGRGSFQVGAGLEPQALSSLKNFLQRCSDEGIYVIGFIPPYAPSVYEQLEVSPGSRTYLQKLADNLETMMGSHNFSFFNFLDGQSSLGAKDEEMIDDRHGSEEIYARILLKMSESDKVLSNLVNIPSIEEHIRQSASPFEVFKW